MSAAGTVIATSAEGAGDMPSLEPSSGADTVSDAAPTFSEVLSLSSPDHPDPNGAAAPSMPPPGPEEPRAETDTVAQVPDEAPVGPVRTPARRTVRQADRPADRGSHGRGRADPAVPGASRAGTAGEITPSGPAPAPPQSSDADAGQGAASTRTPPAGVAVAASVVLATTTAGTDVASRPPSTAPTDGTVRTDEASIGASLTAVPPAPTGVDPPSAGADHDAVGADSAATVRIAAGDASSRTAVDHAGPLGSTGIRTGSALAQPGGSAPVAPGTASIAGVAVTVAGSTDEAPDLTEFPQQGAGSTAQAVEVNDLAASISRPLAGGDGEYSVQVSLHPPELGEVRALLSLQGDVLHVTLTPEHASGFEALTDAMPALHEQLGGGGIQVNVTLGQPGDPQGGETPGSVDHRGRSNRASDDAASAAPSCGLLNEFRQSRPDPSRPVNATEAREQP